MAFYVFSERMVEVLTGHSIVIKSPIPQNAEYISAHYDYERDSFFIVVYHKDFQIVPQGQCIPRVDSGFMLEHSK